MAKERTAIVNEARKHLGKPYSQGSGRLGPNVFDCSGLVYYVFLTATGRKLGTVTWTQDRSGERISVSEVLPGDLYFWGDQGNTSHVAIAIGNGDFIHSPQENEVVKITNIQYFPPNFALRMDLSEVADQEIITQGSKELRGIGLEYRVHIPNQGDLGFMVQNQVAGTVGKNIPLQAVDIFFNGSSSYFEVESHISGLGWQNTGSKIGVKGKNKNLEAFKFILKASMANRYTIEYRSHSSNVGWGEWTFEGQESGVTGKNLPIQAIQFRLKQKFIAQGTANPTKQGLEYRSYVQNQGWLGYVKEGNLSGTTARTLPMEALEVMLNGVSLSVQGHVAQLGWQLVGTTAGSIGKALNLEAFKIMSEKVIYRAHIQDIGWQEWKTNGEIAGTIGKVKYIEAIEIKVI
ncbi:NlpC/P60 family protein [uncultured Vagococcus sp.]|uniref:NlpC/P60 family protein n=1 Tax=uncultured Vagococcus sp. TaxID=189676 RepID=UPI0028D21B2E|nr:NlpC/P60 family protein [uncultured Vagococcus sp.]